MRKIKYLISGTNHDESTWESGIRHETKEAAEIELKKWLNLKTVKEAKIKIQHILFPEEIAEKVWETMYPDRRPWDKLEPNTRHEWKQFVLITIVEYEKLKAKGLSFT